MYNEHQIIQHSEIKSQFLCVLLFLKYFLIEMYANPSYIIWGILISYFNSPVVSSNIKIHFLTLFKQKTNLRNHLGLQTCFQTLLIQEY